MYRLSLETLLGIQREEDHLLIAPCVPAHWHSYQVHYRYHETLYHITLLRVVEGQNQNQGQDISLVMHGVKISTGMSGAVQQRIPLCNDQQTHTVEVVF